MAATAEAIRFSIEQPGTGDYYVIEVLEARSAAQNLRRTHEMRHAFTTVFGVVFALLFGAALYVYAATASIFERYQPGVDDLLLSFDPNVIVLLVVGTPLAATFVPRVSVGASPMARTFARIAVATAATGFLGWWHSSGSSPANRFARRVATFGVRSNTAFCVLNFQTAHISHRPMPGG